MHPSYIPAGILWLVVVLPLVGCEGGGASAEPDEARGASMSLDRIVPLDGTSPVRAVCTTGMVADLVRNVGGGHVEVTQLMGEGIDPHRYQATPSDVSRLSEAD